MFKSPLITQKKMKHKFLFCIAFCLSSFISMAQEHFIDSVHVNYQSNEVNIFVQSYSNGVGEKRRQSISYTSDGVIAYDIFWLECDASLPAIDIDEHQISLDSVPAPTDIMIRLYYDTNIVNFDPNSGAGCFYKDEYDLQDSLYLSVSDQQDLSLDDIEHELNLQYYPNPVVNELVVLGDFKAMNNISVYDISGKQIYFTDVLSPEKVKINTSDWQEGVYFISIRTERGVIRKRIVKVTN